jgi:tRNA-uridine 2-sulfurtransferase
MNKKAKVCVGMSGGVDSSVTAYLLKQQGYDVIGLTFRNWPQDCISRAEDKCCGPQAVTDARMVAHTLDIPYYVVDEIESFQQEVINYFVAEYLKGRTPNPCVVCNEKVKFGTLLSKARALGADYIATGHYARVTHDGRWQLRKGRDAGKDQSYFLFSLRQDQLACSLMPLGDLDKDETRRVAKQLHLKTAQKGESQEICFVPDKDYGRFLRESAHVPDQKGEIVTRDGTVLGYHAGIQHFTIGQREGLRLGGQPKPVYVVGLDAVTNRVIVGTSVELLRSEFEIADCSWLSVEQPVEPIEVVAKIRYNHPGTAAVVTPTKQHGRFHVCLAEGQRAVTPGQAAVFYREELVLGGGWIC